MGGRLMETLAARERLSPVCTTPGCSRSGKGNYGGRCEDCWVDNLRGVINHPGLYLEARRQASQAPTGSGPYEG
jgi:hypothetical protein